MKQVMKHIIVRETAGTARCNEIVRVAVPCARGEIEANQSVSVIGSDLLDVFCQSRILKKWPDGSAKWLLVDFTASVDANGTAEYFLTLEQKMTPVANPVQVQPGEDSWHVDTGKAAFIIDAHSFRPFSAVNVAGMDVLHPAESSCLLTLDGQAGIIADVTTITLEESGPLHSVVRLSGQFKTSSVPEILYFCRLHFFSGSSAVKIEYTIHNTAAARHRGGLWDLGDEGSLLFRSLAFDFCSSNSGGEIYCLPSPGGSPLVISGQLRFSLYQESSGGDNWRSPVHRNREGRVPMERCGYSAEVDKTEVSSGLRASPVVWCGKGEEGLAIAVPRFWQEFPGEIEVADGNIRFAPFPSRFPDAHELQGGEQKTHEFWVDFSTEKDGLTWALNPLSADASPAMYRESEIFGDLPGEKDLVDHFVDAKDLLNKRDIADEYGWRNFGEIYADHEAVYHQGPDTFVSHYNNQYDMVAGLYRKFFVSGDIMWKELAGDLAKHVRDIDLYHTNKDREEYNHGLFWHTDHYVDAGLASHRSFSKAHLQVKPHHLCGGGPGAEHCYTTGLLLHYFHTGNLDYKDAVIAMAEWELLALSGPQTVLAALKRGVDHIKRWRNNRGQKKLFPRYPLTRGTGNAITACLDAFEVTGDNRFLTAAEGLIRGVLHPDDDIESRNLLDAEVAWSYTVLLVAVAKYLNKKKELEQLDAGYDYARASLIAYADWMLEHEYPYLEKPEILEYPNETWAAQDVRKSVIFYYAARYGSPERFQKYLQKARFFYETAEIELAKHNSSAFTRPVVLMLQNGWVGSQLNPETIANVRCGDNQILWKVPTGGNAFGHSTPYMTLSSVFSRIVLDVSRAFCQTSIKRERAWLKARMR
jgi:hypothetical protein